MDGMPPTVDFEVCLRKIKYGFNLLVRAINHIYAVWCTICVTVLLYS